jgi:hypothetical protein
MRNEMTCTICNTSENIIYSGVDAFVLGVDVEKTCYDCANKKAVTV